MLPETKKLGVLLIEAGLVTPAQLQETLRQQRLSGGRLGSALVGQGIITEECLMDFLARQTGVPRLDVKNLEIPATVLQRIPRRLAEQMTILPVAVREPKSLVLAMADPMDLNAMDSARFSSGMNIEPMVAGHTALKQAIHEHYDMLANGTIPTPGLDVAPASARDQGLAVALELDVVPMDPADYLAPSRSFSQDPFFSGGIPLGEPGQPEPARDPSSVIHQRSAMADHVAPLSSYGTRALVLGLIRMLQRRGIIGQDELQRLLANLVEAGEINPNQ
jgi:hypothetical protein